MNCEEKYVKRFGVMCDMDVKMLPVCEGGVMRIHVHVYELSKVMHEER